jgi:hypothetical protein
MEHMLATAKDCRCPYGPTPEAVEEFVHAEVVISPTPSSPQITGIHGEVVFQGRGTASGDARDCRHHAGIPTPQRPE